ncbi:unnamed protein product [Meganyctiphanes norvegica]|uniref:Uncharacterized protein n=1 Tax=Meganyctiphanes norvegica TaxID=48144 RepID=A0AAV2QEZ6_MEGNR
MQSFLNNATTKQPHQNRSKECLTLYPYGYIFSLYLRSGIINHTSHNSERSKGISADFGHGKLQQRVQAQLRSRLGFIGNIQHHCLARQRRPLLVQWILYITFTDVLLILHYYADDDYKLAVIII